MSRTSRTTEDFYESNTPATARIPRSAPSRSVRKSAGLLDLDRGTRRLEHVGELVCVLLREALFHGLGGAFDEVLGLLQAEAGDGPDLLDDVDLLFACGL